MIRAILYILCRSYAVHMHIVQLIPAIWCIICRSVVLCILCINIYDTNNILHSLHSVHNMQVDRVVHVVHYNEPVAASVGDRRDGLRLHRRHHLLSSLLLSSVSSGSWSSLSPLSSSVSSVSWSSLSPFSSLSSFSSLSTLSSLSLHLLSPIFCIYKHAIPISTLCVTLSVMYTSQLQTPQLQVSFLRLPS